MILKVYQPNLGQIGPYQNASRQYVGVAKKARTFAAYGMTDSCNRFYSAGRAARAKVAPIRCAPNSFGNLATNIMYSTVIESFGRSISQRNNPQPQIRDRRAADRPSNGAFTYLYFCALLSRSTLAFSGQHLFTNGPQRAFHLGCSTLRTTPAQVILPPPPACGMAFMSSVLAHPLEF
jgi:hypothetical protein